MLETQHNTADVDCFKTLILQDTLKTQDQHQEEFLCIFGSHTFVPISWMCKKQTFSSTQFYRSWNHFSRCRFTHGRHSRSHSLGFDDWCFSFRAEQNWWTQERATGNPSAVVKPDMHNTIPIKHTNVIPTNIDHIPPNTTHSDPSALLYVFEDNEAVIKMIIKGRSPTMRHVSRTHRVALDWLLDRFNLDHQIQFRYIDTKHQLADILTKGSFTHDEWNNLLHLFNISHFSSTCCTKNFSLMSCSTVAKRIQEQKEEERVLSKSRPAVMNISSFIATCSSTASSPIASKSPGMPIASGKPGSRMSILWRVNGKAAGKPVASRRRRFRRLRQSWDWDLVLQRETSFGRTRCPEQ